MTSSGKVIKYAKAYSMITGEKPFDLPVLASETHQKSEMAIPPWTHFVHIYDEGSCVDLCFPPLSDQDQTANTTAEQNDAAKDTTKSYLTRLCDDKGQLTDLVAIGHLATTKHMIGGGPQGESLP